MIRKFQHNDAERVMEIWLEGNIETHNFIPEEYWRTNYPFVKEQILQAEIYISVQKAQPDARPEGGHIICASEHDRNGVIQGFAGIVDGYLAGIFIDKRYRSLGIGRQLLNYVKEINPSLELSVYKKNKRAVQFYLREGFYVVSEQLDEETGEQEYTMLWGKKSNGD